MKNTPSKEVIINNVRSLLTQNGYGYIPTGIIFSDWEIDVDTLDINYDDVNDTVSIASSLSETVSRQLALTVGQASMILALELSHKEANTFSGTLIFRPSDNPTDDTVEITRASAAFSYISQ